LHIPTRANSWNNELTSKFFERFQFDFHIFMRSFAGSASISLRNGKNMTTSTQKRDTTSSRTWP
jgi:hypothetical protein